MLNERTKYRIANKFINGKVDKDQFDFENKGNYGKGRLSWSVAVKGDQMTFENSSIGFVCFGDNIKLIEDNLGAKFSIDGSISQKKNPKATGDQPKTYWQIVAFGVQVIEEGEKISKHSQDKANAFVSDDLEDEFIPF